MRNYIEYSAYIFHHTHRNTPYYKDTPIRICSRLSGSVSMYKGCNARCVVMGTFAHKPGGNDIPSQANILKHKYMYVVYIVLTHLDLNTTHIAIIHPVTVLRDI